MSVRDLIILGCSSQQPTRFRNHGAYLLRWNDEGLLFDPGEGTQRQFIYADVAPPVVTRIFISHFHGDHCLGFGSMLMRLNLDKVQHPIHCYYPASGKKYFDRLRYCAMYHETIHVVEHPVYESGIVQDDRKFKIEAFFLQHGVDNIAWRVTEPDRIKFDKEKLQQADIAGLDMKLLKEQGYIHRNDHTVSLSDVSWMRKGDSFAIVLDTRYCTSAIECARGAKLFVCESTYQQEHAELAYKYFHMTAQQAATIAKEAGVHKLILTHFSARYNNLKTFEEEARTIFPNSFIAKDLKSFAFEL